jgi:hypothetical protein
LSDGSKQPLRQQRGALKQKLAGIPCGAICPAFHRTIFEKIAPGCVWRHATIKLPDPAWFRVDA